MTVISTPRRTGWNRSGADCVQVEVEVHAEDLSGPELPAWADEYFARERAWRRLLRGTGLVTAEEARQQLVRWMEP